MGKVKIIGIDTGKVYAIGDSKADCFRELSQKYPTFRETEGRNKIKGRVKSQLFSEALSITREV